MTMRTANIAVPSPATSSSPLRVPLPLPVLVGGFCLLWASAFSVAKLAVADCPPLMVLTARFLLAGVVIFGAAVVSGVRLNLGRRDLLLFAFLGIANQAVFLGLGYVGMRSTSSGLAALVISANPVLTAVLAVAFLNERMTWRKAMGLLLGVLVSLVGGTILYKKFAPSGGGLWVGNGVQSLAAGLATLPFAFAFESVGDIVPSWRLAG